MLRASVVLVFLLGVVLVLLGVCGLGLFVLGVVRVFRRRVCGSSLFSFRFALSSRTTPTLLTVLGLVKCFIVLWWFFCCFVGVFADGHVWLVSFFALRCRGGGARSKE